MQKVDKQIQEVEKKVSEYGSDRDIMLSYMKEKEQLRTKEEQLRTEKEQLRTMEEQLRNLLLKERQPQLSPSMCFNKTGEPWICKMKIFLT